MNEEDFKIKEKEKSWRLAWDFLIDYKMSKEEVKEYIKEFWKEVNTANIVGWDNYFNRLIKTASALKYVVMKKLVDYFNFVREFRDYSTFRELYNTLDELEKDLKESDKNE